MDRHQYVKELLQERDDLKKDISYLNSEIEKAKKRTQEYILGFRDRFSGAYAVSSCGVGGWCQQYSVSLPECEQVSDEAIKKIHFEIFELESRKNKLESELNNLKSRDFVKFLKDILNEE